MRTYWDDAEDEALMGLPWMAQLLYLRCLRPYMDYASGIVGVKRGVSYQGMAETLYREPGQGKQEHGSPTLMALRHALTLLERAGLLRRITADRRLIFELVLAHRDDSASEKWNRRATDVQQTKCNTAIIITDNYLDDYGNRRATDPNSEKCNTPPISDIRQDLRVAKATVEPAPGGPDLAAIENVKTLNLSGATKQVMAVFDYWRVTMNHPQSILDNKRSKAIAARLKEGHGVDKLKQAIDGCKASAWHQGKNNRQTVYDDIELICRDAKHVEEFITRVVGKSTQQRELDAWINHDNFIEGECRRVQA
jgi:hypothetical protein